MEHRSRHSNRICRGACLGVVFAAACSGEQKTAPAPTVVVNPVESNSQAFATVLQRDQRIREAFDQVQVGMTQGEVTAIMGSPRDGNPWSYRLSQLSNTMTERDITYTIYFDDDGFVSSKRVGYTCMYVELRRP